ncbi:MAG TPA: SHOCT domain-containing protein [Halomonas sp.]|nr:SHOCT domain-containing protein [Halomonas sp.]
MWGNMIAHMGSYGWGHMLFGGLMMVLFWGGIIALIATSIGGQTHSGRSEAVSKQRPTPLEFLQERYARGEIDKQEYEARRRDLKT